MENWSSFIHEEIFLLNDPLGANTPDSLKIDTVKILGVVTGNITSEEELLLNSILKATKISATDILRSTSVSTDVKCWLIFDSLFVINDTQLTPTKKYVLDNKVIILAHPLSKLRNSQEDKANLWGIIKEEFSL